MAEGTWLATLLGQNRLQTVEVLVVPDSNTEPDETVKLKAQSLINAKPQQPIGTGTIVNDD